MTSVSTRNNTIFQEGSIPEERLLFSCSGRPHHSRLQRMAPSEHDQTTSVVYGGKHLVLRRRAPRRVPSNCEPHHHTVAPRRSSLARTSTANTESPQRSHRQVRFVRTASFKHVPMLHSSEEDKKEIWYDDEELRKLRKTVKKLARKGEERLNHNEDCWRGLETLEKKLSKPTDNEVSECNRMILQLQQEITFGCQGTGKGLEDLKNKAQSLLRKTMLECSQKAAQDAAEAHAIYMESMDSDEVKARFKSAPVA